MGDPDRRRREWRRKVAGQSPTQIADELRPIVAAIIDSLDRWLLSPARG